MFYSDSVKTILSDLGLLQNSRIVSEITFQLYFKINSEKVFLRKQPPALLL